MESPNTSGMNSTAVRKEAAFWALRVASNDLDEIERREFAVWAKQSPENIRALLQIVAIQTMLSNSHSLDRLFRLRSKVINFPKQPHPPPDQKKEKEEADHERRIENVGTLLGLAVSSTYLEHFRRDNRRAKLALGGLSLLLLVASVTSFPAAFPAVGLCFASLAAVTLKEMIVGYRVTHGLFGNTTSEIRALLRFLIKNAAIIDFDGRNGKQRPIFEPATRADERPAIPARAITE